MGATSYGETVTLLNCGECGIGHYIAQLGTRVICVACGHIVALSDFELESDEAFGWANGLLGYVTLPITDDGDMDWETCY